MKKLKLFLSLLMLIAFSVGNVWAADVTYDFTGSGWTVSSGTLSNGTVSFTGEGGANFKMNTGYFMMGKSGAYINFPTYAKAVEKIVVTGNSGGSASTKMNIYVGETAVSTETTGSTGTNTYNIASASQAAGTTYTLKVTSNHNAQITKIEVFYVSETPGGDPDPEPDPEPTTGDVYELFSGDLVEGDYVIYYGGKAMNTTITNNRFQYAEVTPADDKITTSDASIIWHIAQSGSYWTIYNADKEKYAAGTSSKNQGALVADGTANLALWTATESSGTYNFENKGRAAATSDSDKKWLRNNGTYGFATYGSGTGGALSLYKKVDGSVKPAAGLAYAEADKSNLVKVGADFTAPTLTNPNSLTVAYTSSDDNVVAVDVNSGALTIKAAGKAEITASFAGNDDYKAGSAKYTIFVATEAGTAEDPLTEASAKALIDLGCTLNAHVAGTIKAPAYYSNSQTYTVTLTADFQFYKLKDLGNQLFTSDYLKANDQLVVLGPLDKHNTTYQLGDGCYIVNYEEFTEPLTDISNTKETAYTVAQALALAVDPTSDLSKAVYIAGVVYQVNSFNSTNGTYNIYIKDAGTSENDGKFEFYKCSGLYQVGETAVHFEEGDVQEGDEVIGYGVMTYYSQNSIWEFGQPNQLVDLNRPEVAVTGVELDQSTASIEVGETVTLHATVNPDNASNKGITWSVKSGNDKAEVDENGVVTGIAAGEAVVRATSNADNTKYAECTVTVTAADPTKHVVTFDATVDKGESPLSKSNITLSCSNGVLNNGTEYRLYKNSTTTLACSAGNITKIEFTGVSGNPVSGFGAPEVGTLVTDGYDGVWTGNAASITFTASGAQVRATEIKVTYKEDQRADAEISFDEAEYAAIIGEDFTAPTLNNEHNVTVSYSSSDEDLAVVDENSGEVLIGDAEGTVTITATFAGNETYKPATASYDIVISEAPLTDYYEKVTSGDVAEGTYLIVYEAGNVAFNGGLTTLDAESNTIGVTIVGGNKIGVTSATEAATFYIDPTAGTIQSASGKYIGVSSNSNGLKTSDDATAYIHDFSIDADGNAVIAPTFEGSTMSLRYNTANNQLRFRYYKDNGQQAIQLYKLANETVKANPELAWSEESVELTVGGDFTSPTLSHATGITGTITYTSDEETVATVDENGVISLVAEATGTAHITASYAGDGNFKAGTAVCTIKVNPAHSIYVDKLNVNFGSVTKDEAVADQKVTVTLTNVDAATATLGGTNPEAFSITPAALTASGDITISVASTATAGTYAATITISDDASEAESKVVNLSLTVTEPEIIDDLTGTWVLATAVPAIGEKFIVAGTYNSVTKTMGIQNTNNRAAVLSTLAEDVLTPGEGTKVFTLVDAGEGKYAIQASNGKYLTASGTGTKNYLTEAANYEAANAKWTISVENGIASVVASSSNRNDMQYNKSGDGLFSCYDGNQTAIQLYVLQPVTPPTPVYETVREGLIAGNYYTICYPKSMTDVQGATLWSFVGKDANLAYIQQETAATIEAGKPYILYAEAATVTAILGTENASAGVNGAIHGTLSLMNQDALNTAATAAGHDLYLVIGNELRRATGTGTGNNTLPAQRAYVVLDEIGSAPANMPAHVRSMPLHKDTTTGVENAEASEKPVKMVINGQLFILRGEKLYDATGRLVK